MLLRSGNDVSRIPLLHSVMFWTCAFVLPTLILVLLSTHSGFWRVFACCFVCIHYLALLIHVSSVLHKDSPLRCYCTPCEKQVTNKQPMYTDLFYCWRHGGSPVGTSPMTAIHKFNETQEYCENQIFSEHVPDRGFFPVSRPRDMSMPEKSVLWYTWPYPPHLH